MAAGGDDDTGAMRRQLQKESAKTPNGAAFRWAVGAAPNGFLELQLQSLPLPAALVNGKPMLRQDDIAVVVIKAWQIQNEAFDKIGGLAGPVPVLFTAQPEELRTKIERDPDSFFAELNKFMARYKHSFWVKSRAIILIPSGILPLLLFTSDPDSTLPSRVHPYKFGSGTFQIFFLPVHLFFSSGKSGSYSILSSPLHFLLISDPVPDPFPSL